MRIALVTGQYRLGSPRSDPVGRVAPFALALRELGHAVAVYARADGTAEPIDKGLEVHRLPVGPTGELEPEALLAWVPQLAEALLREWREHPPELVHTIGLEAGLAARIAARDLPEALMVHERIAGGPHGEHGPGAPGEHGTHGPHHEHGIVSEPGEHVHRLRAALARSGDTLVAHCPDEVLALRRLGADRRRVAQIPQGVDTERFTPAADPIPHPEPPWQVLCLDGARGGHLATEAVEQLPEATLSLLGGDGATVAHEAVPELLRESDVLVTAPAWADSGTAALEAMACGLPVVASDCGALRDIVVDGVTGVLVPPGHPGRLAHALRELLRDPARRQAFGIAGLDRARVRHSWPHIAAATDLMYQQQEI